MILINTLFCSESSSRPYLWRIVRAGLVGGREARDAAQRHVRDLGRGAQRGQRALLGALRAGPVLDRQGRCRLYHCGPNFIIMAILLMLFDCHSIIICEL